MTTRLQEARNAFAAMTGLFLLHATTKEQVGEALESLIAAARAEGRESVAARDVVVDAELGDWAAKASEAVFYARVVAKSKGYALAVHGSMRRDVDIVAVPWTAEACGADELAESIANYLHQVGCAYEAVWDAAKATREEKPLGRISWAISLKGHPAPYLDLSVAPRLAATSTLSAQ